MSPIKRYLQWLVTGWCIGVAQLIPGVSGGTVAIMLRCYEPLIQAINHIVSRPLQAYSSYRLLISVGLGAGIGIFGCSALVLWVLAAYPGIVSLFLMGIILGSIPFLYKQTEGLSYSWSAYFVLAFGFLGVASLGFLTPFETMSVYPLTGSKQLFLCVSGGIAMATMIIPGVSGSMVLLIMGSYVPIVTAISQCDGYVLMWVAMGAIIGGVLMIKGICFFLNRFSHHSYYGIIGMMLSSVVTLYYPVSHWYYGLLYVGVGFFLMYGFSQWWQQRSVTLG